MPSTLEEQSIIKLFMDLQPIVQKLNSHFVSGRVSYNAVKWDLENLTMKKNELLAQIPLIEKEIMEKRKVGDAAIAAAKSQADKIVEAAQARNVESMSALKQVKEFVTEVERNRYRELSAKVA